MTRSSLPIQTNFDIRDQCLCLAAQRALRVVVRRFDRVFAPLGLTNGQFSMMVALAGTWQPRLGELAAFLAMDATTVTAKIKALEKAGRVQLLPDADDARARRPVLTDLGHVVLVQAMPVRQAERGAVQAGLTGISALDLAQILGRLR